MSGVPCAQCGAPAPDDEVLCDRCHFAHVDGHHILDLACARREGAAQERAAIVADPEAALAIAIEAGALNRDANPIPNHQFTDRGVTWSDGTTAVTCTCGVRQGQYLSGYPCQDNPSTEERVQYRSSWRTEPIEKADHHA